LNDALGLLARHGEDAKIVAGGQSLIPAMNMRLAAPALLVDIGAVPELAGISRHGNGLRIGAAVRQREIETSADVARLAPLLARAAPHIAHAAIRNRGTIGGNLAHADPASELPACMVALRATCNIAGPNGTRAVAAESFFRGVYETDLKPGEILVSVDVPALSDNVRVSFNELARRRGDYAMVGLAAVAKVAGGILSDARFVFFAVADRPVRAAAASRAAEGQRGPAAAEAARAALDNDLDPAGDLHTSGPTKMHLARVLFGRAIAELIS
jgi:carbon-monoxide dehydrogenase medium subunit